MIHESKHNHTMIYAVDRAVLRGENFATSDARFIIREALENL
jgi:hypothetical protein